MGGGPALVRNGKPMEWHNTQLRHPRTAIGWNSRYFYMVEVDGRQHGLSVGMTYPELADYMAKLGCDEALNLDGGGSATFWLYGQVVNSPSEGHERETANGLTVVRKNKPEATHNPD
jgi:exopolysaccharide biosynthesis protein